MSSRPSREVDGEPLLAAGAGSSGAAAPRARPARAPAVLHRSSTRRRLIFAFATLLAVFLAALASQASSLRRMEAVFLAMEERDEQMQLALQLEAEVREQYGHEARFARGDGSQLAQYHKAHALVNELLEQLGGRSHDPDLVRWMCEIGSASDQLERIFEELVAPAVGKPAALVAHDGGYGLVSRIEENVDLIFAQLRREASVSRRELVDLQAGALRLIGVLLFAVPLLVVAAVLYLSRSVARPLARLGAGAAALAAGDLDARIDIDTPDEFGALAGEFNAMTVALKHHHRRLVESEKQAGIGRLAAGVAHELNNPLQVMIGYLSLNRDVPDRRLAEQLAAAEEEARRCQQVVQGLLDLSRPALEPAPIDLRVLCQEVAAGLSASGRACARLEVEGAATATGDGPKVRQVIFNLVKNAVEAAGPAGAVSVRIAPAGAEVEVLVSDSGPGIGPDAQARLFEPFFTTKATGTGLGLAVSRAIALAHGGDVDARNGIVGAVFTLRLPRTPEGRAQP